MSVILIKHKLFVVVWVLLAFVGQTVASTAAPCHQMKQMDMAANMVMMNHSMTNDSIDKTVKLDCCQQDCSCPIGLSVSATSLVNLTLDSLTISTQKIEQYTNLLQSQSLTSLYRPPISE